MTQRLRPIMLNIAPMLPGRVAEITDDIAAMADAEIITHNAFMMTLTPEGKPVTDKAAVLAERYQQYQTLLKSKSGVSCGILLQATLGHGWEPDQPADGQKFLTGDGGTPYIFCPLDPEFRTYLERSIRTLAKLKPDFFMLDDDFRMLTGRNGCFCPLHIDGFNRQTGQNYTATSLHEAIRQDTKVAAACDRWQLESLQQVAVIIREAIDREAPGTPCSFCQCADDVRHAAPIAEVLAGGQAPMIRINNALYLRESQRAIPEWVQFTMRQIAYIPSDTVILDEPDTCPQNRYSTSAAMLHFHLSASLLLGCQGGKLWITRLGVYEPASGYAYRQILRQYSGFYRALAVLNFRPDGIRSPLPVNPPFQFPPNEHKCYPNGNWATRVFGVMGIPFYFTKADVPSQITAISGDDCDLLSDAEIAGLLKNNVLLDGEAARRLTERGFAETMGFSARTWDLAKPSVECREHAEEISIGSGARPAVLTPCPGQPVKIISELRHQSNALSGDSEYLAPGALIATASGGNRVAVIAASVVPYNFSSFAMLNETRRNMFGSLFNELGGVPVRYLGDAELMVWCGHDREQNRIVVLTALSPDGADNPTLEFAEVPHSIEMLSPGGDWQNVKFTGDRAKITLTIPVRPLAPTVLRCR